MNIDKMREEFKTWESEADDGPQTDPMWLMFDSTLNQFALIEVQSRWKTWQASRESLVIELRKEFKDDTGKPFGELLTLVANAVLSDCRSSIEASGLKVKS